MLSHLVYVSSRTPNCTAEEIDKILAACQRNNASLDITGVLLYSDTSFVQYLEGDYKTIAGLYDKIKMDNRHKNAVLISSAPIHNRAFPSWQMGSKEFSSKNIDFKTTVSAEEKSLFENMLSGKSQEGTKAAQLIAKFFK